MKEDADDVGGVTKVFFPPLLKIKCETYLQHTNLLSRFKSLVGLTYAFWKEQTSHDSHQPQHTLYLVSFIQEDSGAYFGTYESPSATEERCLHELLLL